MVKAYLNSSLPYYLNSAIVVLFIYITEVYHRPFTVLWIVYTLVPLLDQIIPDDHTNPTPEEEKILRNQIKWKFPVYLFILMEWVTLFWSISYVHRYDVSTTEFIVLMISVGHVSALGFLFSHELIHKRDSLGKFVGTFDMLKSLYMHFYSEHLFGHHKYVSTPNDPATAKFGQTLYAYLPQTVKGSFINTWKRECKAAEKLGKSPYSLHNHFIQWLLIEAIFTFTIWCMWGWRTLGLFLFQAFLSVWMLETINYIRHYGLQRKKQANGLYEPVTTKHSWNAPQTLQNLILLKLQRHSDHHANAYKPYQTLLSCEDSPNLPCGYAVCVLASFFPPVWFSIVNPLAEATNKQGRPNEEQMEKSSSSLKIWLAIQTSVVTILAIII